MKLLNATRKIQLIVNNSKVPLTSWWSMHSWIHMVPMYSIPKYETSLPTVRCSLYHTLFAWCWKANNKICQVPLPNLTCFPLLESYINSTIIVFHFTPIFTVVSSTYQTSWIKAKLITCLTLLLITFITWLCPRTLYGVVTDCLKFRLNELSEGTG